MDSQDELCKREAFLITTMTMCPNHRGASRTSEKKTLHKKTFERSTIRPKGGTKVKHLKSMIILITHLQPLFLNVKKFV